MFFSLGCTRPQMSRGRLRCYELFAKRDKLLLKEAPLFGEWYQLIRIGTIPKIIPLFVISRTQPFRTFKAFEATYWRDPLFDPPMILL